MYSLGVLCISLNTAFFHDEEQLFLLTIPIVPTANTVQPHCLQLDPAGRPRLQLGCATAAGAGRDTPGTLLLPAGTGIIYLKATVVVLV